MALELTINGQGTFRFPDTMDPKEAERLIRRDFPDVLEAALPRPNFAERENLELKRHEGVVRDTEGEHKAYLDNKGNLTGGHGHLMSDAEQKKYPLGTTIPEEVVNNWFTRDSKVAEQSVTKVIKENGVGTLPEEAKQVLYNMTFNLGEEGIRDFTDMWQAYGREDFSSAAKAMQDSDWFEQVESRGVDLVSRVNALANPTANLPGTKFANREPLENKGRK